MRGYNYPIWKQSEEEICFFTKNDIKERRYANADKNDACTWHLTYL